jgi:peptidyl-prolyl cis-trans isomerase SurA
MNMSENIQRLFIITWLLFPGKQAVMAQLADQVILRINDTKITCAEFEKHYLKASLGDEELGPEEYLELFTNYRLKVLDAKNHELHKKDSFIEELEKVRSIIARPFLSHSDTEEEYLREAYERMKHDLNVSHILVRIPSLSNPSDTLYAWEKAIRLRDQILAGESFESVAIRASDDPSARSDQGNLGFFTAFQMIYPFESAAYDLQVGELSAPVRTQFGYHLIHLNSKRPTPGEVKIRHILIRTYPNSDEHERSIQKETIEQIHQRILRGEDFGVLAAEYSEDRTSAQFHGEMNWFGTGQMIPEFENMAFSLREPGDISEPFMTSYGYHIIQLIAKRAMPSYDSVREEIRQKLYLAGDERAEKIQKALVEQLKEEYSYRPNHETKALVFDLLTDHLHQGTSPESDEKTSILPLFTVSEQPVTAREFIDFVRKSLPAYQDDHPKDHVSKLYDEFVSLKILELENSLLEEKYPEFRFQMNEYHDGLLLFDISEQRVWNRSVSDTTGLEEFYNENKSQYLGPEMIDLFMFQSKDLTTLTGAHKKIVKSARRKYPRPSHVYKFNRKSIIKGISSERVLVPKDSFPQYKTSELEKGITRIAERNGEFIFLVIFGEKKPVPQPLDSVRGLVISDYQDYLEENWIQELKNKHEVIVNKQVFETCKNQLSKQNLNQ